MGATPLRVLVVDDDAETLDLLSEVLKAQGHQVLAAPSGNAAIAGVDDATRPFHVAVVDWTMAGISGKDVIDYMRHASPATLCVIATGHTEGMVPDAYRQGNVVRILRKPFSLRNVAGAIAQVGRQARGLV